MAPPKMVAMRDVSAAERTIIYGTEPDWGAGVAWFPLVERWDTTGWLVLLLSLMVAMRDVSAAETTIIYGTEPDWGAGVAWFLLVERWDTIGWLVLLLSLEETGFH